MAYAVFAHGDPARLVLRLTTRGGGDADAMRIAHTRDAMAWIGLSLIALALALLRTTSVFPGAWALLPTVGTALLISAGPKAWVNRTILSHPAVVGIGLISYPLYLWHWPVLALIRIHYPDVSYVAKGGALLGAFVAAYLTYRLLERWVRHTSGTRIVVALCTVQAMLLAAGLVLVWKAGFPARGDAVHRRIYAVDIHATDADATPSDTIAGLCMIMWDERAFDPRCYTPPSGANPPQHVVLWGDSFAAHWRPGLKRILGDSTTISQMTSAGCAPILDYVEAARPNCAVLNRFALARIAERMPDVVVLSGRWSSYPAHPQVSKTLDALKALGIPRVILIGSSAQYHQPVPRLLLMALSSGAAPTRMQTRMMPSCARSTARCARGRSARWRVVHRAARRPVHGTRLPGGAGHRRGWDHHAGRRTPDAGRGDPHRRTPLHPGAPTVGASAGTRAARASPPIPKTKMRAFRAVLRNAGCGRSRGRAPLLPAPSCR
ncbi:MAG: hypothetical protein IPN16_25975 [Gemmatimonadetes bacterium]|nr:hypothetical protein [Gemmatimonadota bacterium]